MKTIVLILACAISFFVASLGINYLTEDMTRKSVVRGAISALVFDNWEEVSFLGGGHIFPLTQTLYFRI